MDVDARTGTVNIEYVLVGEHDFEFMLCSMSCE